MRVHRFMSDNKYQRLKAGKRLKNSTVHAANGNHSESVGFCFFTEEPEEAIHWLSGIVSVDWCVTLDIPDRLLTKSKALYRDPERDNWLCQEPVAIWRTEWCLQAYSTKTAKIIKATDDFATYGAGIGELLAMFFQSLV